MRNVCKLSYECYSHVQADRRMEAAQNITTVSRQWKCQKVSSSQDLKKPAEGGNARKKHTSVLRLINNIFGGFYVSSITKTSRNVIPIQIAADLPKATGTHVFARTVSRRLNEVALSTWKPVRCISPQSRYR